MAQTQWNLGVTTARQGASLPTKTQGFPDGTEIKICSSQLPTIPLSLLQFGALSFSKCLCLLEWGSKHVSWKWADESKGNKRIHNFLLLPAK